MATKVCNLVTALLVLYWTSADAQYRRLSYEFHVGFGTANVFGDLGGAATRDNLGGLKDLQFSQTRPTFYVAGCTDLNEHCSVKINLFAGIISGNDKGSLNDYRAYSYSGQLIELSGQIAWNFLNTTSLGTAMSRRRGRGLRGVRNATQAYAFVGAGVAYAKTVIDTHGKELSAVEYTGGDPLGLVIPFGLGIKSDISTEWAVGFELGRRFCSSDYLDGFTTDFSKSKDLYYFATIHAIYKISVNRGRLPRRR